MTEKSKVFTFLGFEYRWGLSRSGKPLVKMRTSKTKFQIAFANIRKWIRAERNKLGTATIMRKLRLKLLGYWNYYGVSGNIRIRKLRRLTPGGFLLHIDRAAFKAVSSSQVGKSRQVKTGW